MRAGGIGLLVLAALFGGAAQAEDIAISDEITSAYTEFDIEENCVPYELYELGGSFSCAGFKGYSVLFSEGDLRQSVFYGYVGEWFAEGAFESFSEFNNVSGTIEWRLKGGVPFATIHRWFISGEDAALDESNQGQVLVISKVAQPGRGDGCVAGYVDALENENANVLAREIADTLAADFPCRIEDPEFHGNEGLKAGFPFRTFGP